MSMGDECYSTAVTLGFQMPSSYLRHILKEAIHLKMHFQGNFLSGKVSEGKYFSFSLPPQFCSVVGVIFP